MKNTGVLSSVSRLAGGLQNSVRCLHQALADLPGMKVSIFGTEDIYSAEDVPEWAPLPVKLCPIQGPRAFSYAPTMLAGLLEENIRIIHSHGIWQYPSLAVGRWHERTGRPYLVSPHGMLDPWAVRNSHWKKILADAIYQGSHLRNAACIRALCESEAQAIRSYGLKNPICIIPNGIDLPLIDAETLKTEKLKSERKILLFLGRLHPKKGLVNALKAWKQVLHSTSNIQNSKSDEWQFVVAGWDQGGHEADLKRLCDELGLKWAHVPVAEFLGGSLAEQGQLSPQGKSPTVIDTPLQSSLSQSTISNQQSTIVNLPSVTFVGPAFGAAKDALLRRASAFILPSFSEGLPMSVLEAWSYRLPVLMTDECNLPEGFAANAAIRIGTDAESITAGLHSLLGSHDSDLQSLGENGRQLVSERFTWPQIAAQMKEVYDWVLGGGDKPCSVVL